MITLPTYDIEEAGSIVGAACKARDAVGSSGRFQAPSGGEG